MPLHFSSKDFEIFDLDPPTNPKSHYGACHFGYSLALSLTYFYLYPLNKFSSNFHGSFLILYILHIFDMSVMCVFEGIKFKLLGNLPNLLCVMSVVSIISV